MNPQELTELSLQETWVSAFIDGEATLTEQTAWCDATHEQLFYYTVTRQVLRGEHIRLRETVYQNERATLRAFWARVDAT